MADLDDSTGEEVREPDDLTSRALSEINGYLDLAMVNGREVMVETMRYVLRLADQPDWLVGQYRIGVITDILTILRFDSAIKAASEQDSSVHKRTEPMYSADAIFELMHPLGFKPQRGSVQRYLSTDFIGIEIQARPGTKEGQIILNPALIGINIADLLDD
jgi:hypothetical protein